MASTIPYIGSKISLISNSEIRYEGILYTINTQESTIALQSVKTFGTEGRKMPEIPPSSEIYDFIIFRGQDIKDLTVLEGAQNQSSPMASDPAIMSMNQRPSGGQGKDSHKGGGKGETSKGKGWNDSRDSGKGWNQQSKGESKGWGGGGGGKGWDQGGGGGKGWDQGGGKGDGWGGSGRWNDGGKGRGDAYSGGYSGGGGAWGGKAPSKGKDYYAMDKGKGKGGYDYSKGKYDSKGKSSKGKGKGDGKGDGGKGGGYGGKDSGKGQRRSGGGKGSYRTPGMTAAGVPVGELLPEENSEAKKAYAEDLDLAACNAKFEKVEEATADSKAPLSGYNKSSSFFDNISCEATDRAADTDRQKIDRDKARQFDKETFGDTRRPPRPVGVRRGKGKGSGKN